MKLTFPVFIALACAIASLSHAQVGIGTSTPHSSSIIEVSSTTKGFLPPRFTHGQRENISNPSAGLLVYCTDCCIDGTISIFDSQIWNNLPNCPEIDADDDAIPNNIDIDDDNDGIPDIEEFLRLDFINYTSIPSGLSYSSNRGFRITDASGQYAIDVYDSYNEFQPETSHTVDFHTSDGEVEKRASQNSNKRAYAVITWTTENSPSPWQFESLDLNNIQSLSSDASSSCDAYAFDNNAEWNYLPTTTTTGVILSTNSAASNKIGSFLTEDPDADFNEKPHNQAQIGTDPSFEPAYSKSGGSITNVLLNVFGPLDGHSVRATFPTPQTKSRLHIWDAGEPNSMSWGFIANSTSYIDKDTDNDGTPNHLDLDSDNDGCFDAIESGAITNSNQTQYISATGRLNSNVGANGLHSSVETNDGQTANTTYTINPDYLNQSVHSACP